MNGKEHSRGFYYIMCCPLVAILVIIGYWQFFLLAILSASIYDPDEDQKWENGRNHRYYLTHSILWGIIISYAFYWFSWYYFRIGLFVSTFPIMIHLWLDLYSKDENDRYRLFGINRQGKYCIKLFGKRLSGGKTVLWLIANIILMVVYDVWFVVYGI